MLANGFQVISILGDIISVGRDIAVTSVYFNANYSFYCVKNISRKVVGLNQLKRLKILNCYGNKIAQTLKANGNHISLPKEN